MTSSLPHDIEYFLDPIVFLVEGRLFRLPREYFTQASGFFLDMLSLPQPATGASINGEAEDTSDVAPLPLPETVKASAFHSLVQLLFPGVSSASLTKEAWLEVLNLSDLWDMTEIRKKAIEHLHPLLEDDPGHRLMLAKKYSIADWLRPALDGLVRRSAPLGARELDLLGQETLLKIAAVRERCYPVLIDADQNHSNNRSYNNYNYGYNSSSNPSEDVGISYWMIKPARDYTPVSLKDYDFTIPSSSTGSTSTSQVTSLDGTVGAEYGIRHGGFFFEKIVFKVQEHLFRVPNQPFAQHSALLRREFEKRGFKKYDQTDPLVLEGASVTDFEAILSLFFPPQFSEAQQLTSDQWASVLRLSAKWEMEQVKQMAVNELQSMNFGSVVLKLNMAKEVCVQQWFSSAVETLITQASPLTTAGCQALGNQELVLRVLDLRERVHCRVRCSYRGGGTRYHIRSERGEIPASCDLSAEIAALSDMIDSSP